jgi:hypothetical protein
MPNPTIAAGYPKAFLDYAVSRGGGRQMLIERSHIRLDDLRIRTIAFHWRITWLC